MSEGINALTVIWNKSESQKDEKIPEERNIIGQLGQTAHKTGRSQKEERRKGK